MRKFKSKKVGKSKNNSTFSGIRRIFLLCLTIFGLLPIVLINLSAKLSEKEIEEYKVVSSVLHYAYSDNLESNPKQCVKRKIHPVHIHIDNQSQLAHLERSELNWYMLKITDDSFSRADILINRVWDIKRMEEDNCFELEYEGEHTCHNRNTLLLKVSNVIFHKNGDKALLYVRESYPEQLPRGYVFKLFKNENWLVDNVDILPSH